MPERSLGFAQAIISGDRLNLSLQVFEDLRRTSLAYLLAISGLHKGLLTTVVFGLLRMVCAVIPIGHIRWHARSIAAIHFNQISQIGYIANLLAVPVMALVVAPAAVIALALSLLHLEPVGFWFVDLDLTWIQCVVGYLADFDLAVRMIKTPLDGVLPLFSFGVLWCVCGAENMGNQLAFLRRSSLWGSGPQRNVQTS